MHFAMFPWFAMRRQGVEKWLLCPVNAIYKDVKTIVRVGDGFSEEFDVVVGVHHDSVLSQLLLIIV